MQRDLPVQLNTDCHSKNITFNVMTASRFTLGSSNRVTQQFHESKPIKIKSHHSLDAVDETSQCRNTQFIDFMSLVSCCRALSGLDEPNCPTIIFFHGNAG